MHTTITQGHPMKILGFDHVQLAMPKGGEAQAKAFYPECCTNNRISSI